MSSTLFFFSFIPILSILLLSINFILASHKPYKEKNTPFECGYHSFFDQNRIQFNVVFFTVGLLFLIFDIEILVIYPAATSSLINSIYGIVIVIIFILILGLGFVFELGKNALTIYTIQNMNILYSDGFFNLLDTKSLIKKFLLFFIIGLLVLVTLKLPLKILLGSLIPLCLHLPICIVTCAIITRVIIASLKEKDITLKDIVHTVIISLLFSFLAVMLVITNILGITLITLFTNPYLMSYIQKSIEYCINVKIPMDVPHWCAYNGESSNHRGEIPYNNLTNSNESPIEGTNIPNGSETSEGLQHTNNLENLIDRCKNHYLSMLSGSKTPTGVPAALDLIKSRLHREPVNWRQRAIRDAYISERISELFHVGDKWSDFYRRFPIDQYSWKFNREGKTQDEINMYKQRQFEQKELRKETKEILKKIENYKN